MTGPDDNETDVSRRRLLTGAGMALAGGVGLATAGAAMPAAADSGSSDHGVAEGPDGSTVAEFRGRITQTGPAGETFTSFGYLGRVNGAEESDLFSGTPHGEGTALLTVFATGELSARLFDQAVHSLDIEGSLAVYQRREPGASFADPDSFRVGRQVAEFAVRLQDVLTVFAPAQGLPTLTGDMRQTSAGRLRGGLSGQDFGHKGLRLRLFANGLGHLLDPATSNSFLEIAGNWSAE